MHILHSNATRKKTGKIRRPFLPTMHLPMGTEYGLMRYRNEQIAEMDIRKKIMKRKYSVFIFNVASCSDRSCNAYGREYSIEEMFDRVKSIPLLSAVDLVMNEQFRNNMDEVRKNIKRTGLGVAFVAVDTFANPIYQQGSLSSILILRWNIK